MEFRRLTVCLHPGIIAVVLALALGLPAGAAPAIKGSASVWAYLRDDSVEHVQYAPTLAFTASEFGAQGLRFEGSVRGFFDVTDNVSRDRQYRILRGVFIYAPQSPWEFRVGQQWLTEGVGRGNVAGAWVRHDVDKRTSVTAYGGARLPYSLSLSETNDNDGFAAGIHVRTRLQPFNVGASYYYAGKHGELLYHAAGLEAHGRITRALLARGRFEMNAAQATVERAQLIGQWTARKDVLVTGEFRASQPRIYENSFFTTFLSQTQTKFARAAARWEFIKQTYVRGGGTMLFADAPDPLYKVQAALGRPCGEAGFTHWVTTNQGTRDGFYVQARFPVTIRERHYGDIFGGYDWSRGSSADADLRDPVESHAAHFGAAVTPCPLLTVTIRAEQIQDLQRTSDWRALGGVTYRFATR